MKVKPQEPRNPPGTPERRVKDAHQKFDESGREMMDPLPIAPPIGYKKAPSIAEQIRNMIKSEKLRQEAEAQGYESFEEADDFDVDDFDPKSPYEEVFEPLPQPDTDETMKAFASHIGDAIMAKLGPEAATEAPQHAAPADEGSGRREPPPTTTKPSPSLDFTTRKPKS